MTITKFRWIDIAIFSFVAAMTDIAVTLFGLLNVKFYLAISTIVIVLVYVRWHKYGLLTNGFIILVHFMLFGLTTSDWIASGLHALSFIGFISILGWLKIDYYHIKQRFDYLRISSLFLLGYFTVFMVEWGLYSLLEPTNFVDLFLNHIITIVIGLGLCLIMIYQENLVIDMTYYLRHKNEETTS